MSANAASAASLAARMSAVYLTAARVYLAPAGELGALSRGDAARIAAAAVASHEQQYH